MGRLNRLRRFSQGRLRVLATQWGLPGLLVVGLILSVNSVVKADPAPSGSELSAYLQSNKLEVATDIQNGYQQVYYTYKNQKIFITNDSFNHAYAAASGAYVVWEGTTSLGGQIFMYNILSKSLLQLTSTGTNEEPYIHQNQVVWRAWDGIHWQIYYYDGLTIKQVTSGLSSSVHGSTDGKQIIYAEQLAPSDWKAQAYDIATTTTHTLREGDEATTAFPSLDGSGGVITRFIPF